MQAPLWPWVETNQGLFSVLALCLALLSLLIQIGADMRTKQRQVREYVDVVLGLIDPLIGEGESAADKANSAPSGEDIGAVVSWNSLRAETFEALEAVRLTPPPQAELAVAMVRLSRRLSWKPGPATFDVLVTAKAYLSSNLDNLRVMRTEIASLRYDRSRPLAGPRRTA